MGLREPRRKPRREAKDAVRRSFSLRYNGVSYAPRTARLSSTRVALLSGMGSVVDLLGGTSVVPGVRRRRYGDAKADMRTLASDWASVRGDFFRAWKGITRGVTIEEHGDAAPRIAGKSAKRATRPSGH